jgi:hypothetical protein
MSSHVHLMKLLSNIHLITFQIIDQLIYLVNFGSKSFILMVMVQYFISFKTFFQINYLIYFFIEIILILILIYRLVLINCNILFILFNVRIYLNQ